MRVRRTKHQAVLDAAKAALLRECSLELVQQVRDLRAYREFDWIDRRQRQCFRMIGRKHAHELPVCDGIGCALFWKDRNAVSVDR